MRRHAVFVAAALLCSGSAVSAGSSAQTPLSRLGGVRDDASGCAGGVCGSPRHLTPLLEAGKIDEALATSEFRLPGADFPAHAGLLTVRGNSSLFFVLQPCDATSSLCPAADDELTLWLQGGPGGPSQFGLFVENGPFYVEENLTLSANPFSWTRRFSMLWIDQPVGTGFSSAGDEGAYCTDDLCSAKDLYSALEQITTMFPQYKHLRITGESYGGKWVPSAASYVLRQQHAAEAAGLKAPLGGMTLAGISMGDGWTDPINMLPEYVPLLNYVGILDEHGLASFGALMQQAIANTTSNDTAAAFRAWDAAINGDLTPGPPLLERLTGLADYFNYDRTTQPAAFNYWSQYVVQPAVRQKLGVGNTPLHDGLAVEMALVSDFMLSQADNLIFLLNNDIPALVYVGQLDIIVGPALVDAYLKKLQWTGLKQYLAASRGIWKTADEPKEVAGWARVASPLTHVVVRNVGHIAPFDAPQRMFNLITAWADGKPLTADQQH